MENNADNKLDLVLSKVKLDNTTEEIVDNIVEETDINKIKDLTNLFNITQIKKNALRLIKLNKVMDAVSDQMLERVEKRPGEFSNDDLIKYMTTIQGAIDKSNKSIETLDQTPQIQLNQQNINLTVDDNQLDREERERVLDAVQSILTKLNIKQ